MKTINLWSVAMSVFFSLSLSESIYEAGRDHLQAAAGNLAPVERTLADMAARMGVIAADARPAPAPGAVVVANANVSSRDLTGVVAWVEGLRDPGTIDAPVARALGIGLSSGEDVITNHKGYRNRSTNEGYMFNVVTINGRRELVVGRLIGATSYVWRVDVSGRIITTVFADARGGDGVIKTEVFPNDRYERLYYETVEVFISRAPKPTVG